MNYNVETTSAFEKDFKRLARKYPSLKNDIIALVKQLALNPFLGKSLGNSRYKIRIAIVSKGKGKSGGGRVVTNVRVLKEKVYLLAIYDKSEYASISDAEILKRIKQIEEEQLS